MRHAVWQIERDLTDRPECSQEMDERFSVMATRGDPPFMSLQRGA